MKQLIFLTCLVCNAGCPAASPDQAAAAVNALGLDLYRLDAAASKGNILLSPWSISSSLTMLLSGAAGATKEEMVRILHMGSEPDEMAQQVAALRLELENVVAQHQQAAAKLSSSEAVHQPGAVSV